MEHPFKRGLDAGWYSVRRYGRLPAVVGLAACMLCARAGVDPCSVARAILYLRGCFGWPCPEKPVHVPIDCPIVGRRHRDAAKQAATKAPAAKTTPARPAAKPAAPRVR
jgi:hypothetical protein